MMQPGDVSFHRPAFLVFMLAMCAHVFLSQSMLSLYVEVEESGGCCTAVGGSNTTK